MMANWVEKDRIFLEANYWITFNFIVFFFEKKEGEDAATRSLCTESDMEIFLGVT